MESKEKEQKQIESYINSYNNFDIENMLKDLHQDIEFVNITNGEENLRTIGINEFKNQAELSKGLFSSREQKIIEYTFDVDNVEIDIAYNAILASDLPNGLKKGEQITLAGKSVFEFKDGKISRITDIS